MLANYEEKLNEIKNEIIKVGEGLLKSNQLIVEGLTDCNEEHFVDAKSHVKNVSNIFKEIDNNIITTLALHSPEAKDLRRMVSYLKITNELLRAIASSQRRIEALKETKFH